MDQDLLARDGQERQGDLIGQGGQFTTLTIGENERAHGIRLPISRLSGHQRTARRAGRC